MSGLVLTVDGEPWRNHLQQIAEVTPGLVPVAKGNGYGFGLSLLAQEAEKLGAASMAVGSAREAAQVRDHFSGDIVVLQPWRPQDPIADELLSDPRIITTVSRPEDLAALAQRGGVRVLIEALTSMRRHGFTATQLTDSAPLLDDVDLQGWTVHLPLLQSDRYGEALEHALRVASVRQAPMWFSHLPWAECLSIGREVGVDAEDIRLRMGTGLWLGAPETLHPTARVLDVHRVAKGEPIGYRQRRSNADGWIVVVAGGTAHGVAMEAPSAVSTLRQRLITAVDGALTTVGRARSPYTIAGKKRWFTEPPHMQSSLVFVPAGVTPPAVGDDIPVEVRLTTVGVDEVVFA